MLSRFVLIFFIGSASAGQTRSEPSFVSSRIEDRIVKRFDFDERKLGNYERTPMNWRQLAGPGYPRFLEPRFDADVGHDAPPSFRLALQGGNLACHYLAKDIPVHPDSDYRITVWIQTSQVKHSEAYLSAYFLDHALQRIDASSVRSAPIRGLGGKEPWQAASVYLPGGYEKARWIGLSCHLEQPSEGMHFADDLRPIEQRDPHATAWFDDITVLRLPRVTLRMESPGSVFTADEPVSCIVRVADVDGRGLLATLDARDGNGHIVGRQTIPIVAHHGEACVASLGDPAPGRYVARLTISAAGDEIVSYERPFVRLNRDLSSGRSRRGNFGLILDPTTGLDHRATERLVTLLSPDAVKIPLWRADMNDDAVVLADHRVNDLVLALAEQASIVGVLAAPPFGLAEQLGRRGLSVVEALASPFHQWRPYLGFLFSRYGERVHAWQVGSDDATAPGEPRQVERALKQLRETVRPLAGTLQIAIPQDAAVRTLSDPASMAEIQSLYVGGEIAADRLSEQLDVSTAEKIRRWATMAPLDASKYSQNSRLREESRRWVLALQAGVETVFVPQPWTVQDDGGEAVAWPSEEFLVYRTLHQTLSGLSPMGRVWLDHGVSAWLFGDPETDDGALVVWTDGDEGSARSFVTDVAPRAKSIDLWGAVCDAGVAMEGKSFTLNAMPIILMPVSPSRVKTMASLTANPPDIAPTVEAQRVTMSLRNEGAKRIIGRMRLVVPPSWRISPSQFAVDVSPGQEFKQALAIRLPINQAAGAQTLVGRFRSAVDETSERIFRTPLNVRSPELEVKVMTRTDGQGLTIVQRVTNRTPNTLHLQGLLIAPNQPRQVQLISHLVGGQSVVREYQIENGAAMADRWIRVSVEQVDGPLRHNDVIKVE